MNLIYKFGYLVETIKYQYAKGKQDGYADARTPTITAMDAHIEAEVLKVMKTSRDVNSDGYRIGGYIPAIKKHRQLTCADLKTSKDYVDALYDKHNVLKH